MLELRSGMLYNHAWYFLEMIFNCVKACKLHENSGNVHARGNNDCCMYGLPSPLQATCIAGTISFLKLRANSTKQIAMFGYEHMLCALL